MPCGGQEQHRSVTFRVNVNVPATGASPDDERTATRDWGSRLADAGHAFVTLHFQALICQNLETAFLVVSQSQAQRLYHWCWSRHAPAFWPTPHVELWVIRTVARHTQIRCERGPFSSLSPFSPPVRGARCVGFTASIPSPKPVREKCDNLCIYGIMYEPSPEPATFAALLTSTAAYKPTFQSTRYFQRCFRTARH